MQRDGLALFGLNRLLLLDSIGCGSLLAYAFQYCRHHQYNARGLISHDMVVLLYDAHYRTTQRHQERVYNQ